MSQVGSREDEKKVKDFNYRHFFLKCVPGKGIFFFFFQIKTRGVCVIWREMWTQSVVSLRKLG